MGSVVKEELGRAVVELITLHRLDEAELIRVLGKLWQTVGYPRS